MFLFKMYMFIYYIRVMIGILSDFLSFKTLFKPVFLKILSLPLDIIKKKEIHG